MPVDEIMNIAVTLVVKDCPVCGMNYAIPRTLDHYKWSLPQGHKEKGWYCPNGHYLVHRAREVERLRERVDQLEKNKRHLQDKAEHFERSAAASRGHLTKLKKRVANGVCPECHRTFAHLAHHMQKEHPDFANEETVQSQAQAQAQAPRKQRGRPRKVQSEGA